MENGLTSLFEFEEVLKNYQVSNESKQILAQTNLVLMVAPSAAGRNTIIQKLHESGEYYFVVSDTTRQPRKNNGILEQTGREYWFRKEEEILSDLKEGKFLEAAVIHGQQVSGISIRELKRARDEAKIAITDVEIVGVHNIVKVKPDVKAIFVLPPSFKEWLKRMDGRGQMPASEKRRRMQSALEEFTAALKYPYYRYVVNDTLDHATGQIHAIAHGSLDKNVESEGRILAEKLYEDTKVWLDKKQ